MKKIFICILAFLLVFTSKAYSEISEDAKRHMVRGETAIRMAENPSDYNDAIAEFNKVIEYEPNMPEGYYYLSVAQEGAGEYKEAIKSLNKYLELAPGAGNKEEVQEKIYALEYMAEKSEKKAEVKEETKPPMSLAEKLEGTWYARFKMGGENFYFPKNNAYQDTFEIVANGNALKFIDQQPDFYKVFYNSERGDVIFRLNLAGTELSGIHHQKFSNQWGLNPPLDIQVVGDVSQDGNIITLNYTHKYNEVWNKGNGVYVVYKVQQTATEVVLKRAW